MTTCLLLWRSTKWEIFADHLKKQTFRFTQVWCPIPFTDFIRKSDAVGSSSLEKPEFKPPHILISHNIEVSPIPRAQSLLSLFLSDLLCWTSSNAAFRCCIVWLCFKDQVSMVQCIKFNSIVLDFGFVWIQKIRDDPVICNVQFNKSHHMTRP